MISYKNTPTRTYTRTFKNKEEGTSLGHGELPVEYESACRLCLNKTDVMCEIFSDLDSIVPISVKMKNLLGLEVYEEDRLPPLICDNCLCKLDDGYNFKKRSLASDVKLRQYLCTPLKATSCSYFELQNEDREKGSYSNSGSEENLFSLKPLKEECTIRWDDQVPLAAIISSATPEIFNNNLTKPPTVETVSSDAKLPQGNWNQVVYDDVLRDYTTGMKLEKPVKSDKIELRTPVKKSFKVITSTNHFCKVKPNTHDNKVIDIDDIPLSERIIIENERYKMMVQRRRPNQDKRDEAEEIAVSSQDEPGLVICEDERPERVLRYMHVCPECSKGFLTPSLLTRHRRVHTGEKPFCCDICDSAFSQKEILQRHKAQVHTEIKPYKCKYCDKSYGTMSILAVHIKTAHIKYGQYKCKHCSKIFRHASGLSRHQNTHNGVLFYCKICGKHFNDGSSVKRHVNIHKVGIVEPAE